MILFPSGSRLDLYIRLGSLITEIENHRRAESAARGAKAASSSDSGPPSQHNVSDCSPASITLIMPPWCIFKQCIDRLAGSGLLELLHNTSHILIAESEDARCNNLLQSTAIRLAVEAIDIKTACRYGPFKDLVQ